MKKRLLSAALALAMVLTMLPLSVFAASAPATATGDGTEAASYHAREDNTVKGSEWEGPGWYAKHDEKDANGKVTATNYVHITSGFIVSGKYYKNFPTNSSNQPLSTTFTAIGAVSAAMADSTSVTVDLYGGYSTGTTSLGTLLTLTGDKLTNITVKDSQYASEVNAGLRVADQRGAVTLPTTFPQNKSISINLSDVTSTSTPMLQNKDTATPSRPLSNTITLTNAKIGKITIGASDCADTNNLPVYTRQTITANRSSVSKAPGNEIGEIDLYGNGSQVNLTDTKLTGAVSLTGPGNNLTVSGQTTGEGDITLTGSTNDKVTTGTAPSVTVNGGSLGAIKGNSNEELTSNITVNVNKPGSVKSIDLKAANVTINGGKVTESDGIKIVSGALTVSNGANVGAVEFGGGKITGFNVSGGSTLGEVSCKNGTTPTFDRVSITGVNTIASLDLGNYGGHGVAAETRFTTTTAIAADHEVGYLPIGTAYRVKTSATAITYFAKDKLSEAIAAAGKTNAVAGKGEIALVGTAGTTNGTITLASGGAAIAKIVFSSVPCSITLPSVVNGVSYSTWMLKEAGDAAAGTYKSGQNFTRSKLADCTLDAQGSSGVVTKLSNATVVASGGAADPNGNVKVVLKGTQLVLSGAIKPTGSGAGIIVKMDTDLVITGSTGTSGQPVEINVTINWDPVTKKATFAKDLPVGYGITFPDENTMRLDNGTTYTVSGTGLSVIYDGFTTISDASGGPVVATVTASGYATQLQKDALIKKVLGAADASKFVWNTSPALRQAVNAAQATITESQVNSWIKTAKTKVWQKTHTGSPTDAQLEADPVAKNYTHVILEPYLAVTITNDNPLTMNMVPSYRIRVGTKDEVQDTDIIIDNTSRSLGALNSDLKGTDATDVGATVTLANVSTFLGTTGKVYAHQDGLYVYEGSNNSFTFTNAGKTGLGSVVINTTAPLVTLKRDVSGTVTVVGSFDSLQAAVDATKYVADETKVDEITVTNAYTGSGSITVSGAARTFKIITEGNTTISSNANADLVKVTPDSGHTYTIQLLKDNATATSTVSISVNTATGGSASVSSGSAKPGDTVTVTPRAVSGYKVSGVTAVTNTGASVPVKANSNGTYTFTVPANATKVTVTPRFVASENRIFPDVDPKSWYGPSVKYCYETTVRGVRLMEGDANGNFAPNAKLTRAQMVQMLYNLAGRPTVTGACPFPDVVGTGYDWAAAPITWAAQKGYVIGYSDGKFHPEVNVSRQDMVLILYRYAKQPAIGASGSLSGYYDASSVGSWAYDAVRWAASMGILSGTNSVALNGYINGPVRANRCEVAVTLANFHRLYG